MDRAYSILHVRSVSDDARVITGVATSPKPDRMNDVVEPLGIVFKNPLPLLLYHDSKQPVGTVKFDKPTKDGITFTATIARVAEPGRLKERVDEAWQSIKERLLRGVSIGFRAIETAFMQNGGVHFLKTEVLELSLVAVPANQDATIQTIKSFDRDQALSGVRSVSSNSGVPGSRRTTSMNVSESLTAEKANLQIKSARLEELMNDDQTNGGLEAAEAAERDTLIADVKSLTAKVSQLQTLEAAQAAQASALTVPVPAVRRPAGAIEVKTVSLPKGTIFTRVAMALAAGRGSMADSIEYAKQFSNTPEVVAYIKGGWHRKAVPGSAVVESPGWGSELVNPNTAQTEFVELLRAETIIGKVQGFRRAEFNIPIITQTGGSTFEWVGAHQPKPVGELAFERTTLGFSKIAGIVVMDEELVRLSTPNAEAIVRQDMIEQGARFIDQQFIRVAVAATDVSPASITNGEASPSATGTTAAALRHDLNIALKVFTDAGVSTRGIVIVMTSALARGISLLSTTLGVPEFPTMTPEGGTLLGYQVIVSDSVDSGTVVLFQPREILLADDGRMTLDASREATLDMSGGSTATFNLWQNNCVGLRAERWIRWQKRRAAGVVAIIDTAAYAPA